MDSRERLSQDFAQCYAQMCAALGLSPLASVTAYAKIRTLSINADKIGSSDWVPLLNALKINAALETIIIRSYANTSNLPESQNKSAKKKSLAIKSEELVSRLCKSIRDCLAANGKIKTLSLVGLNLRDVDVKVLSKGIQKNKSLTQLSLERSLDGAKQFEDILHVVRNNMKISCINLSACRVDATFAHLIADYIRNQMSLRHDQVWQDGLRYRRPAMDSMGGLRRMTINDNPEFGDEGVGILCSVMKEDIWIKAVDIQNCNITNEGGTRLLKMLELNASLVVVDARQNAELGSEILQKIRHQCRINWGTQESEFKWLSVNESERKNVQHMHQKMRKPVKSISTPSTSCNSAPRVVHSRAEVSRSGVPWRAASRANRLRNNSPERREASTPSTPSINLQHHQHSSRVIQHNEFEMKEKDLEIKNLRDQLNKLTDENSGLLIKCKELEKKQAETEETLDVIENSFASFHNFLDMLKQIGLGPLIEFAKLNDSSINWNPEASRLEEPFNNQSKQRPSEHEESQLDVTNQMRSFLEERNFNPEHLKMENMTEDTRESRNTSKFDKLIDQVLRNGENLIRISSVSSGTTVKDLVDNIACSISADNIENHKYSTAQRVMNTLGKDFPKEGLKAVDDSYYEHILRETTLKNREKLKAIENNDYSSHFDPTSSSDSATGGLNRALASRDDSGKIETQSRHPLLPNAYLREELEDDESSLDYGNGNISFDSVTSDGI